MNAPRNAVAPTAVFAVSRFPRWAGVVGSILVVGAAPVVHAASITWNNTGTDFNAGASWVGGSAPGAGDAALFSGAAETSPNLSASLVIQQLNFNTTATHGYTLSSSDGEISLTLTNTGTGTGSALYTNQNTGLNTISAPLVLGASSGSQTFRGNGGTVELTGPISQANPGLGIYFQNGSTWVLAGENSFTGGVTMAGGIVLNARTDTAFGTGTAGVSMDSASTVQLEGGITIADKPLGLRNDGVGAQGALRSVSGENTWSGPISLAGSGVSIVADAGSTLNLTSATAIGGNQNLTLGGGGDIVLHGGFQPTGTQNLYKTGAGTVTILGGGTYGGPTSVSGGVLNIRSATALGTTNNGTTVESGAALELQGGIAVVGETLSLAGSGIDGNGALRNLSGDNSWSGAITVANSPASHRIQSDVGLLTIAGGITETGTAAKTLVFGGGGDVLVGGSISGDVGDLALTKDGGGTLTLAGANTYTGATTVAQGTLLVGGSIAGAANVASGATLGGSGTIGGAATISGIVAPGDDGIGTLTVANDVTWNAADSWQFELGTAAATMDLAALGGSTEDLLAITGATSDFLMGTGSGWTFDFQGGGEAGWYQLVDWEGTTTFAATDFGAPTNLAPGLTGSFIVDSGTSALYLEVVPEASVALLSALGALGLLRRRR